MVPISSLLRIVLLPPYGPYPLINVLFIDAPLKNNLIRCWCPVRVATFFFSGFQIGFLRKKMFYRGFFGRFIIILNAPHSSLALKWYGIQKEFKRQNRKRTILGFISIEITFIDLEFVVNLIGKLHFLRSTNYLKDNFLIGSYKIIFVTFPHILNSGYQSAFLTLKIFLMDVLGQF